MTAILSQLSVLAFVACGLLLVLSLKRWAGKLALVATALAIAAALAPRLVG